MKHMCLLMRDRGLEDPPGIRVRAVQGSDGCAYLAPGALTNSLSYVMGPLLNSMMDLGYTDDNLAAMPYDWRLPLHQLEERDGYFSHLTSQLEKMTKKTGSAVVVLCHSMGNRTFQWFLRWKTAQPGGKEWVKKHVHTFMAAGAPFLGAPKVTQATLLI
jgi:hypothetical protein